MLDAIVLLTPPGTPMDDLAEAFQKTDVGATVHRASDRRSLMLRIGRARQALAVVDLEHGDGTTAGDDVIAALRARHEELPILAVAARDSVDAAGEAIRAGATDFLVRKPPLDSRVETFLLKLRSTLRLLDEAQSLEREASRLKRAEDDRYHIVGESPQMKEIAARIRRVAKVPRPVLIRGERGTGKELVARAIHRESPRASGPFVAVNCAALPDTLLESELFGHEKGAFTGAAHASAGKFEQASGGTLFLDEIGNMSLPFQQKILRVVEYRSFTRVGGHDEIRVDTRIIAATNANLEEKLRDGRFLHDLYDRLAFEVIDVPPLRDRAGEIEVLATYFLNRFMQEVPAFAGKSLSAEAVDLLHGYPFPGNVRELKNIIERAVYRDTTNELDPEDIGLRSDPQFQAAGGSYHDKVAAFERQLLVDALNRSGGNRAAAARELGLRYHQLRHLLSKHGLDDG